MNSRIEESALGEYGKVVSQLPGQDFFKTVKALMAIADRYPETQTAQKCRFWVCILRLAEMSLQALLVNALSEGIQVMKKNGVKSLFDKNKALYASFFQEYSRQLRDQFQAFARDYGMLLFHDDFAVLHFRLNVANECSDLQNPLPKLAEIKAGIVLKNVDLACLYLALRRYIFLSTTAECLGVQYVDDLGSLAKKRLCRAAFYHLGLVWLKKLRDLLPANDGELLLQKNCQLVMGLIEDASHPWRQEAFETWITVSKANYYPWKLIEEQEVADAEDGRAAPEFPPAPKSIGLVKLILGDLRAEGDEAPMSARSISQLPLDPSQEMRLAQENLAARAARPGRKSKLKIELD